MARPSWIGRPSGLTGTHVPPGTVRSTETSHHRDPCEDDQHQSREPQDLHPPRRNMRGPGRLPHSMNHHTLHLMMDLSRHFVYVNAVRLDTRARVPYTRRMPKLWNETIDAHRRAVRDATLDTVAQLVAEHGVASVTMSQIAQQTGIGRATLYKYYPDVEAILTGWHERQVGRHLELFTGLAQQHGSPLSRLERMLEAYAQIVHEHHGSRVAAMLHSLGHVAHARNHLSSFLASIIGEGVATGEIVEHVATSELAIFCLNALAGAADLPSKAAVSRLVQLTLSAVRCLRHPEIERSADGS